MSDEFDQNEEQAHDSSTVESVPKPVAEEYHAPRVARSVFSGASSSPVSGSTERRPRKSTPRPRRMNMSLVRLDAWSVAKVAFLLAVAGGIIQIIAVSLIWAVLNAVGVFDQITQIVSTTGLDAGSVNLADIFSLSTILSAVTIFSIVEVVIATLLSTIGALLYNVVSALVGGVHATLGDD